MHASSLPLVLLLLVTVVTVITAAVTAVSVAVWLKHKVNLVLQALDQRNGALRSEVPGDGLCGVDSGALDLLRGVHEIGSELDLSALDVVVVNVGEGAQAALVAVGL